MSNAASTPRTGDKTIVPMDISYNGFVVYNCKNIQNITSRCSYFDSLVRRWNSDDVDIMDTNVTIKIHDIPSIPAVSSSAVEIVLRALEYDGEFPSSKTLQVRSSVGYPQLHEQIIEFAFYLGCNDFILPIFCVHADATSKQRVAYYLCQQGQEFELQSLLFVESFFHGFDKSMIPLQEAFCFSLEIAMHLVRSYKHAPSQTLMGKSWGVLGSLKRMIVSDDDDGNVSIPTPLEIDHFALLIIQKFASAEWSPEDIKLLFSILPTAEKMAPATNELDESLKIKPEGLERFLSRAILLNNCVIPKILRHWDGLDVTLLAPALLEAKQLDFVTDYADPGLIIRTITDTWTAEDCLAALEENRGGIRTLFQMGVTDADCGWLAAIPIFHEACRHPPRSIGRDGSAVQRLLFRRLFLHRDFDLTIPPSLMSSLPLHVQDNIRRRISDKALLHAVLYLENDSVYERCIERLDLPWNEASLHLTERVASVLRNDDSVIWKQIDISKLRGRASLDYVPTHILSRLAYEEALKASNSCRDQQKRIRTLEGTVQNLKDELRRVEREHKRQRRESGVTVDF